MLHAQNVAPLPHCFVAVFIIFIERFITFSEFLHIIYTKTTTLIKGPFETPCGFHELMRQRRGNDAAAVRQWRDSGAATARHSVHPA
jgi:hypothetical protein